ncbi:MAG: bifunctional 4-hydroxy-2-oxoglutarate aldolase/2-dehydro-3-deoxy-phosphogluconate aldolase [Arcicella sp.]|nr:bifunctional 4-hydroxy-2-oxoglutarate aldolase/2-dehydro-3-deoxy-phosphogluconate aldolase [Arcicella sp.]
MKFTKEELYAKLSEVPIMPLFNHSDLAVSKAVVKACYDGGIKVFEYTNRGEGAALIFAELVKYVREELPDMAIGIGTVFNAEEAEYFVSLDTDFIVQPILNIAVGAVCNKHKIAWMPGVMTISEIYNAQQAGADIIKIFPANVLGTAFIKALKAPMPHAKVMVTGGVEPNEENLKGWFSAGVTAVGMGSQLFPKDVLASGNYKQIEEVVKKCIAMVKEC